MALFRGPRVKEILVGIDYGTCFTKVAYRILGTERRIVPLPLEEETFLLPSGLYLHKGERRLYPLFSPCPPDCRDIRLLKWHLREAADVVQNSRDDNDRMFIRLCNTYFLKNLFCLILQALQKRSELRRENISFDMLRFNICIPTARDKQKDEALHKLYQEVAGRALSLALDCPEVTPMDIMELLKLYKADGGHSEKIEFTHEALAQCMPYLNSQGREKGKHAIIDIGGGTIDIAILGIGEGQKDRVLGDDTSVKFYTSHVLYGGMNKLEERLLEEHPDWAEDDRKRLYKVLSGQESRTEEDRRIILDHFETIRTNKEEDDYYQVWGNALKKDHCVEKWQNVKILLSGGGARLDEAEEIFREPWYEGLRTRYDLIRISPPDDFIKGDYGDKDFGRMLVAYGLCMEKKEYPEDFPPYAFKGFPPREREKRPYDAREEGDII